MQQVAEFIVGLLKETSVTTRELNKKTGISYDKLQRFKGGPATVPRMYFTP